LNFLNINALAADFDAGWIEDEFDLAELIGVTGDEV
jgi:hypothetical protein